MQLKIKSTSFQERQERKQMMKEFGMMDKVATMSPLRKQIRQIERTIDEAEAKGDLGAVRYWRDKLRALLRKAAK